MTKRFFKIFCGLLALISANTLHSAIFESDKIETVLEYADKKTLVLLDITSTLYEPSVTMADKRWRSFFAERAKKVLGDADLAQKLSDKVEGMLVTQIPKKLLETCAPDVVKMLQDQKIPTFGLTLKRLSTSYASNFGEITYNNLVNLGIDLQKSLSYTKVTQGNSSNYTFAYGMIFTNKKPLGIALEDFLPSLNKMPKKIVVVENSFVHLKEIEESLSAQNIEFVGIRYNRGDAKKAQFDPTLGIIQFLHFVGDGQILSDEQALMIKTLAPNNDWNEDLETFISQNA